MRSAITAIDTPPGRIALFPSRGVAAVIEQRPDPREADQHWRLQLAPMERPIPFRDRRFRGTSEAKKSSTSKPHQNHVTQELTPRAHHGKTTGSGESNSGRLVKHARYYWLFLAESHLTRRLFGAMLQRIWALPVPAG